MDKNTTIGLIIIGVILSVFSIFNQPSEAEIKQQEKKIALQKNKEAEAKKNKSDKNSDNKSSDGQSKNDKGQKISAK